MAAYDDAFWQAGGKLTQKPQKSQSPQKNWFFRVLCGFSELCVMSGQNLI
jgi:hypothetical protein